VLRPVCDFSRPTDVRVYAGKALSGYGFPDGHPFGSARTDAFWSQAKLSGLLSQVNVVAPKIACQEHIERFHTHEFVEFVKKKSLDGTGFLDSGDTPAFAGVYKAAACVVGTALDGLAALMDSVARRVFIPLAGLHHARRDAAAGFCVFNDIGVLIESLRIDYGITRVAYIDIDAHHGDGVYYSFAANPSLFIVDVHEDGCHLFPGTGSASETGVGLGEGTKCNFPLQPGAGDEEFFRVWERAFSFLEASAPEFIILQCGADGLAGDPLTHLSYSSQVHARVTRDVCRLAEATARGRVMALGGGGYEHSNIAQAWCAVIENLVLAPRSPSGD